VAAPETNNKTTDPKRIRQTRKHCKEHVHFLANAHRWLPREQIARSLSVEALLLFEEARA